MTFKPSFLAPWLLALAPLAQAGPVVDIPLGDCSVKCSVGFGATHTTAGAFTDQFSFDFDGWALVDASIDVHFNRRNNSTQRLQFPDSDDDAAPDVDINGVLFSYGPNLSHGNTVRSKLLFMPEALGGPFLLTVSGCAGPACNASLPVSASYSGLLNIERIEMQMLSAPASDVPEPTGLALALTALGAAALARRRR